MSDRSRTGVALVLACLMHFVAEGALRATKPASPSDPVAHAQEAPMTEVDIAVEPPPPSSTSVPNGDVEPARAAIASVSAAREVAGSPERLHLGPESASNEGPPVGTATPPAGSSWTFSPTPAPGVVPRSVDLLVANGGWAKLETAPPVSTTGGLIETMDAADVARGLGRGGPVLKAVGLAARAEDAPLRGTATFSVTIFSDGKIDVQVASNQTTDWASIIPAIRDAVRQAQVRLPPNSRGLNVVVAVDAKVKYPEGYEPPPEKTTVSAETALAVDKPLVNVKVHGRRCSAGLAVAAGGVAVGADCAVGTAARIVSTHIVSEARL